MKTNLIILIVLIPLVVFGQFNISTEWTREFNFGGTGLDNNFWGMVLDSSGNIYLNGKTASPLFSSAITKRDSYGNLVWSKTDTMTSSNTGVSQIFLIPSKDKIGYFSVKSGEQWLIIRNPTDGSLIEMIPMSLQYNGFSPYAVEDSIVTLETGNADQVIIMDEHGNIGRSFSIGENVSGFAQTRILGNYIWVFGTYLSTKGFVAKYQYATGQQLWRVNFENLIQLRGEVDSLGNSYFSCSQYVSQISYDFRLVKINPSGGIVWDKQWKPNPQWDSVGNQNVFCYDLAPNINKGIVVFGGTVQRNHSNDGKKDAYLSIRSILTGDSLYAAKFQISPSLNSYNVRGIEFTKTGKMLVMGVQFTTLNSGWLRQYIIDTLTGVQNQNEISLSFELSQNYPNPFNPVTCIMYHVAKNTFIHLVVYDALGREIAVLVNEIKPAGNYSVNFDGSNLPSGIYFYKITAGDFTDAKKMVLIK